MLTGARQVGKTSCLQRLSAPYQPYVSLDNPLVRSLAREDAALFMRRFQPPVLIDEIQYALTPFGVQYILRKHARTAADSVPTLGANRVYPHMLRHSAASHFLHEDVDMVTISRWVGHANLATTCIYAEVDLESKRKAVQAAKPLLSPEAECAQWRTQADTFGWLESR